jgi:hypothetical protein
MLSLVAVAATNWVVVITSCTANFGTNFRALATTSLFNFMRGATFIFIEVFKQASVASYNKFATPIICMIFCCIFALFLLKFIPETFGKDMEFAEDEG